jgi:O-antigen ligase
MPALESPGDTRILWLRRTNAPSLSADRLIPRFRNVYDYLAAALVLLYFLRMSILPVFIPQASRFMFLGVYGVLVLFLFVIVVSIGRKSIQGAGLVFLSVAIVSCLFSPYRSQALQKGIGLLMLMAVLGPVLTSKTIAEFRQTAWSVCRLLILFVGITSVFWYFLRLPNFGRGPFTGVLSHCMLTGPVAGMACLIALLQAFERKSAPWGLASLLCVAPMLASGSRIACLSLAAGGLVALIFLFQKYRFLFAAALPLVVLLAMYSGSDDALLNDDSLLGEMTQTLRSKGTVNTREEIWNARIEEYKASPVLGIGIGMGRGAGIEGDEEGRINIEPGSAYLAILSMTGTTGAAAFLLLAVSLGRRFMRRMNRIPQTTKIEILSLLTFLSVHAIAEGWILAVGSLFCMIYWLVLGRMQDLSIPGGQ